MGWDIGASQKSGWDIGAFQGVASGTSYSLTCDSGSFSLVGADATLTYGSASSIAADPGTFLITGAAAGLVVSYVMVADVGSFTTTGGAIGFDEATVINHESIALFDIIPATYRDEAKKRMLMLPGESHGRAYAYGLDLVEADDANYVSAVTWTGAIPTYTEASLRYSRSYYSGAFLADSCGEEEFYTNAAERADTLTGLQTVAANMGTGGTEYGDNILFGFGWCWDMTWHNAPTAGKDPVYKCGWAGASLSGPEGDLAWGLDSSDQTITGNSVCMDTYLDAISSYNVSASAIDTIYTTGPVDGEHDTENGYQRNIKHEYIREHVRTNGGVLLDYADILSWNYTTDASPGDESWTDGDSTVHSWRGANTSLATGGDGYDGGDGGCHITEDACLLIGKALWVMLALDAGWDGTAGVVAGAGSYTFSGTSADLLYGRNLQADGGSFALTGLDVNLRYGVSYSITAEAGAFTLSGSDVAFLKALIIAVDSGDFDVVGSDADLDYLRALSLSADTGSLTISGQDATLIGPTTLVGPMYITITSKAGSVDISSKSAGVTVTGISGTITIVKG